MKLSFEFIIYSIPFLVALASFLGITFKILRTILSLNAGITYAGLFYMESMQALKFNLPKNGSKRLFMDMCAGICSGTTIGILYYLAVEIFKYTDSTALILSLKSFLPLPLVIMNCICLIVIYFISRSVKPDDKDKDWFDKIMDIKLPKFFDKFGS